MNATFSQEASEKSVSPAQHAVACSCEILLQLGTKIGRNPFSWRGYLVETLMKGSNHVKIPGGQIGTKM